MALREPKGPALESSGPLGKMSLPRRIYHRAFSHDDALQDPTPVDKVPVVKARATHVIMNSLITKQTHKSIQCFEQKAGLRNASCTPPQTFPPRRSNLPGPIPAPWILEVEIRTETHQINGASSNQDPSRSLIEFFHPGYKGAQKPSPMGLIQIQAA
ncbi:hypothetical protein HPG69_007803 [Diceros bicornis minor]|uniref:Putative monooxygenase p33MONOX n=1 Tax=Diceros bicornis minor TaxID=77932 RepID=A0A7J7EAV9_DICBM|nr:hypothetical protein HPG69_007803 [Diceros bicornis minor]